MNIDLDRSLWLLMSLYTEWTNMVLHSYHEDWFGSISVMANDFVYSMAQHDIGHLPWMLIYKGQFDSNNIIHILFQWLYTFLLLYVKRIVHQCLIFRQMHQSSCTCGLPVLSCQKVGYILNYFCHIVLIFILWSVVRYVHHLMLWQSPKCLIRMHPYIQIT